MADIGARNLHPFHIMLKHALIAVAASLVMSSASAQIFEVIEPDVDKGSFELEILNGVTLTNVESGEERSAHAIEIGYSPFSWWKITGAIEITNPSGENAEIDAYEWENVFLAPIGNGNNGDGSGLRALGLFVALEVPNDGGFSRGELAVGPIAEFALGPVTTVANLFVQIPFTADDPGLAYALSAAVPVARLEHVEVSAGFEAHGGADGAFGDALPLGDNTHVLGPAVYSVIDIGRGRTLEPRLAVLFGLTEGSPDAVASLNIELNF
jgi:hypothetical protein